MTDAEQAAVQTACRRAADSAPSARPSRTPEPGRAVGGGAARRFRRGGEVPAEALPGVPRPTSSHRCAPSSRWSTRRDRHHHAELDRRGRRADLADGRSGHQGQPGQGRVADDRQPGPRQHVLRAKQSLAVGGPLAINGATYTVVGLVNPTLTGNTADVYFTLPALQKLASKTEPRQRGPGQGRRRRRRRRRGRRDQGGAARRPGGDQQGRGRHRHRQPAQCPAARLTPRRSAGRHRAARSLRHRDAADAVVGRQASTRDRHPAGAWLVAASRRRAALVETTGIGLLGGVLGIGVGYLASYGVRRSRRS